ncbi:MAG: hypothetical protein WD851_08175 [Pirellulales bacterium]
MRTCFSRSRGALAMALFLGVATAAMAVPYASGVRNTAGTTWEFVLNDVADAVTVLRDGGNALTLGTTAGRYTFDMAGFSDFEIQVSKSAATGYSEIGAGENFYADFERPTGMAVNNIPSSPFFGTIYVNNALNLTTATGRVMGDGVYALTADRKGVDFSTPAWTVPAADDTAQAKHPGFTVDATGSSAWRLSLDDGGNVIVSDWSDSVGGIKYAAPNLLTGGLVLAGESGPTGGVLSSVSDEFGLIPLHGSIVSKPIVTGTVGVDLTVWALDEDLDKDLAHPGNDGNSLWRWDVGNVTTGYDINPTLVINAGAIPRTDEAVSRLNFFAQNNGVIAEAHYEPQFEKFYLMQPRDNGNESSLIVLSAGAGGSSVVEWSSLQFSIDNNLDGFTDTPVFGTSVGLQDIFREAWAVELSDDKSNLFVLMSNLYSGADNNNPYIGPNSPNLNGHVLIIPLDEQGIPDVQVSDNGTPGDTTDDFLSNVEAINIGAVGNLDRVNIDIDAAGNVYVVSNITERLQVFSPGGSFTAITGSDGTFSLEALTPPDELVGDYNNDGSVNAADYAVWRDNNGGTAVLPNDATPGTVDLSDYNTWRANFGNTAGSGSAAVPEPSTFGLALLVAAAILGRFIKRN